MFKRLIKHPRLPFFEYKRNRQQKYFIGFQNHGKTAEFAKLRSLKENKRKVNKSRVALTTTIVKTQTTCNINQSLLLYVFFPYFLTKILAQTKTLLKFLSQKTKSWF